VDTGPGTGPLVVGNNRLAPLVVIVGETASGKSELALELAERFNGEIICADSRTVYRGMDIGTAKPTKEDQARVPHHLLDIVDPGEVFTVADFKRLAEEAIQDISMRSKLPIMVGGTGLYIDAVVYDYTFATKGARRDTANPRHVAKADSGSRSSLRLQTLILGLSPDREVLRTRVAHRVDAMVASGFVDELRNLVDRYGWDVPALQAPGYKAFRGYMNGSLSMDEAKALFVQNDLQLAKRQRTWFKRNNSIHWIKNRYEAVDITTTFLSKITD
jgi:tRNA dimethylallyltransferase